MHVSAKISGLMLLQAHLQISGPGLDQQVGKSASSGEIKGDVTVPKPGYFTLAVIGNGTKCTYQTAGFSAKERASASSPAKGGGAAGRSPRPGSGGHGSTNGAGPLPTGNPGNGAGGNLGLTPLNGASPFSLPSVAPDGSSQGFPNQIPNPDPQVAAPRSQHVVARNVSNSTPIKWGQSLAVAALLLLISAHLGMWSRRQRLAAEGIKVGLWGFGRRPRTAKAPEKDATTAAATALADPPAASAPTTEPVDLRSEAAPRNGVTTRMADKPPATGFEAATDPHGTIEPFGMADRARAAGVGTPFDFPETAEPTATPDNGAWDEPKPKRSNGNGRGGYQGRRRRS